MTDSSAVSMSGISFPSRLYMFLGVVDDTSIASWQPHGRCFRIHQPKEFVKRSNPSWFKYTKYSSFQRQLNIYGFQRIQKGTDKNCYYHKHFLRGHPHLLNKIERIPLKKEHATPLLCANQPDFYSMPPLPETGFTLSDKHIGQQEKVHANDIQKRRALGELSEFVGRTAEELFVRKMHISNSILNEAMLFPQAQSQLGARQNREHLQSSQVLQWRNNMESSLVYPASLGNIRSTFFGPGNGEYLVTTPQPSIRQILRDGIRPTILHCDRYGNFQMDYTGTLQVPQLKDRDTRNSMVPPKLLSSTPLHFFPPI